MILSAFTLLHVALSLVGIHSGFVVVAGVSDRETEQRLDRAFFSDDGFDKRDRIPVSVP